MSDGHPRTRKGVRWGIAAVFVAAPLLLLLAFVSGDRFGFLNRYDPQRVNMRNSLCEGFHGYSLLFSSRSTPEVLPALRRELTVGRGFTEFDSPSGEVVFERGEVEFVLYSELYDRVYGIAGGTPGFDNDTTGSVVRITQREGNVEAMVKEIRRWFH